MVSITVGNCEVRCTAMGGLGPHGSRWTGQWSVYILPRVPDDEAVAEGITDVYETAAQAQEEGLREGADKVLESHGISGILARTENT